ncbi:MAG TPA: hypothetical protein VN622_06185 [Clostridia bacterium]|nr:hypothetical protein [Clostridia bacterium]
MKRLSLFEKSVAVLTVLVVAIIVAVVGGYWWSNSTPHRPRGVPESAVFLRAPATGAPGAPRGQWLSCWVSEGHNRCKLTDKDGSTKFEGDFLPYGRDGVVAEAQLKINLAKTTKQDSVWAGDTWVPLVYLDNGEVLIPAVQYEKGKLIVEKEREKTK